MKPAKRGKSKIKADYSLADLYDHYKSIVKDPLPKEKFKKIWVEISDTIMNEILNHAKEFRIPARLGHLRIKKSKNKFITNKETGEFKTEFFKIDYKKTLDYWEQLYPGKTIEEIKDIEDKPLLFHTNRHSDYSYYRFYWDKTIANFENQTAYSFTPIRKWKETLTNKINSSNTDYYE